MVSVAPFSINCLLLLTEFLCKICIYRNYTNTLGIFIFPIPFFLLFFYFHAASTVTKSKSSSGPSYILCIWEALGFRLDSEGVVRSFDGRLEYFQNQRYTEFYVPRILVIMIDTAEHWQFQNGMSLHSLLRQFLRKVTEPKLQKYIVLGPQKGLKHNNVPLLGEPQSGKMKRSGEVPYLGGQKWHGWGALSHPMKSSVTPDMSAEVFQWQRGPQASQS